MARGLVTLLATAALLFLQLPNGFAQEGQNTNSPKFEIVETTVAKIQAAFRAKTLTSLELTQMYIQRINLLNPILHAVLEVNPDALTIAAEKDKERAAAGGFIGGLHGIPILLKDNIATKDKMNTTAGSFALLYSIVPKDANLLVRLRKKGAVILGKCNLSQWANYRSYDSISGWTSRGGFAICPYNFNVNPSGSSSGSGVAAAANLAAVTLGSETDGSIISPSNYNSAVGLKPTIGLVSRAGVIPISHSQDTVGPICRTVSDAVAVLDEIHVTKFDPEDNATSICLGKIPASYSKYLDTSLIKGKRLGILGYPFYSYDKNNTYISKYMYPVYQKHIATLKKLGAVIINPVNIPNILEIQNDGAEGTVLSFDFKQDLNAYLAGLVYAPSGRTIRDLYAFNANDPREDIKRFDQKIWNNSIHTAGYKSPTYLKAKARDAQIKKNAFDTIFAKMKLDAYVAPTPAGAGYLSAKAGYPIITVPAGYAPANNAAGDYEDMPYGLGFYGLACSEPTLISIAYAFEQATKVRKAPQMKGTMPSYSVLDPTTPQPPTPYPD